MSNKQLDIILLYFTVSRHGDKRYYYRKNKRQSDMSSQKVMPDHLTVYSGRLFPDK